MRACVCVCVCVRERVRLPGKLKERQCLGEDVKTVAGTVSL